MAVSLKFAVSLKSKFKQRDKIIWLIKAEKKIAQSKLLSFFRQQLKVYYNHPYQTCSFFQIQYILFSFDYYQSLRFLNTMEKKNANIRMTNSFWLTINQSFLNWYLVIHFIFLTFDEIIKIRPIHPTARSLITSYHSQNSHCSLPFLEETSSLGMCLIA